MDWNAKNINSRWRSASRPDLALLASGKFALSETQTLTCTEASMTQFIAQKLGQRKIVWKSQHIVGEQDKYHLLRKHHVQSARRANEKLRACFTTCKVWVSPKFGVKGHYIHQIFKLSFLKAFMHTFVYSPVTTLVQTRAHVQALPTFTWDWHLSPQCRWPGEISQQMPRAVANINLSKQQLCCLLVLSNAIRTD